MTDTPPDKALLPPMRLEADDLDPEATAVLRATRERLSKEFQAQLEARQMDGLAPLAQQIAEAELSLGMVDEALGSFRRAAQLLGDKGEVSVLAAILYATAEIERSKDRPGEAQTSYLEAEKAFARAGDNGDKGARATSLLCAGEMGAKINRIGDSLETYHDALELFRECSDRRGQALTLFRSAEAMSRIDRDAAKKQYGDARDIYERIDKDINLEPGERAANHPLPDRSKDLRTAEPWLMAKMCAAQVTDVDFEPITDDGKVHRTRVDTDRKPLMAAAVVAVVAIGGALLFRGEPEPVQSSESAPVEAAAEPAVAKPIARARALSSRAATRVEAGDYAGARAPYEQALEIYRRAGDPSGQGDVLSALASMEQDEGNALNARELYSEASASYEESRNFDGRTATALAITAIDESTGNTEKLEESYARQAEACALSGDRAGQAYAMQKLIDIRFEQDDLARAYEMLLVLLPVNESANDTFATARALEQIGAVEMITGVRNSTRAKLQRAYTLYRESDRIDGQARTLIALGDLDMVNEQPWQARATYRQVLSLLADNPQPDTQRAALIKLAMAESTLGQNKRANELFEEALQTCTPADGDACQDEIRGRLSELNTQG